MAARGPLLVGALIGLLSMATFYFSNQPIGASTAYARIAGLIGKVFSKRHTESLKFYQETKPSIQWDVTLLLGIPVGSWGALICFFIGGVTTARLMFGI